MAKILIAEDEPAIRSLLRMALEKEGYDVSETDNGTKTLQMIKREKPDLLILDVMLPGMDGHTLQLHLAQDAALKSLPVIVITAVDSFESMFAKFPQVKKYIMKPFDPVDVMNSVATILGSKA